MAEIVRQVIINKLEVKRGLHAKSPDSGAAAAHKSMLNRSLEHPLLSM
jgi:hypothetical protein